MNKAIKYIKVPELAVKKIENIQFSKNSEVDTVMRIIICQADYKAEELDVNHEDLDEQVKDYN